jgi:hypothetical protein
MPSWPPPRPRRVRKNDGASDDHGNWGSRCDRRTSARLSPSLRLACPTACGQGRCRMTAPILMPGEGASCGDAAGAAGAASTTSAVRLRGGEQQVGQCPQRKTMRHRQIRREPQPVTEANGGRAAATGRENRDVGSRRTVIGDAALAGAPISCLRVEASRYLVGFLKLVGSWTAGAEKEWTWWWTRVGGSSRKSSSSG